MGLIIVDGSVVIRLIGIATYLSPPGPYGSLNGVNVPVGLRQHISRSQGQSQINNGFSRGLHDIFFHSN